MHHVLVDLCVLDTSPTHEQLDSVYKITAESP